MVSRILSGSTRDLIIVVKLNVPDRNDGYTCMDAVSQSTKVAVMKSKVDVVIKLERTG